MASEEREARLRGIKAVFFDLGGTLGVASARAASGVQESRQECRSYGTALLRRASPAPADKPGGRPLGVLNIVRGA